MTRDALIVEAVRTPIGSYAGSLSGVRADDLAAHAIRELLAKCPSVPKDQIEDVVLGCANQAGEDNRNVARMASLLAGLPVTVPGLTVNRLCASGMSAVVEAAAALQSGNGELFIAGGVEQMSRAPWVMRKPEGAFSRQPEMYDTTIGWRFVNPKMKELFGTDSMGETAENVAVKYGVAREAQDEFALNSQKKAAKAQKSNRLAQEIATVQITVGKESKSFNTDEFIRHDSSIEALSKLKAAFKQGGSVTAGNSSGLNDGACAILLASEVAVKKYNLTPLARIAGSVAIGVEPKFMGIGPVPATEKVLKRLNLKLSDLAVIELNEAFAAQSIACLNELKIPLDDPRVNPNGGAIALGHPLGMSGARLIQTATRELHIKKERYALCTMCVGVGQGVAVVIERI